MNPGVYKIECGNSLMVISIFRPNDSRMIMALGECYEKLDRLQEAKKCFWKAHRIGDIEETSLFKLAKYDLFLTLKTSITIKVICFCCLLKCLEATLTNSVDPD